MCIRDRRPVARLEDRDFGRQYRTGGNHTGYASIPVAKMRGDLEPARSADAHPVDAVEQSVDERAPVDSHAGDECLAVVFEPGDSHLSPRHVPPDRLSAVQPKAETDQVILLPADYVTGAWD